MTEKNECALGTTYTKFGFNGILVLTSRFIRIEMIDSNVRLKRSTVYYEQFVLSLFNRCNDALTLPDTERDTETETDTDESMLMSVSGQYEFLPTILYIPFLSVSLSVSVLGRKNTPKAEPNSY